MFKMLILQNLYGVSDEALEYQVSDRLTFMPFLGIDLAGTVPDAKTVWLFRERLREGEVFNRLFEQFHRALAAQGVKLSSGQIVDASFVEAPRQCNTREENETIKDGAIPKDWPRNAAKRCQKDIDARWTKKNDDDHDGYKTHVSVDHKTKLVIEDRVMAAHVHDSQVFDELLGKPKTRGSDVWAGSAYRSGKGFAIMSAREPIGVGHSPKRSSGESEEVPRARAGRACVCDTDGWHDRAHHRNGADAGLVDDEGAELQPQTSRGADPAAEDSD